MNRPFYALAALVATLTGSAVGIGPARCPSGVSRVAIDARAYCAMPSHANSSHYFVHFEEGASSDSYDDESYGYEDYAPTTQGSDSNEETKSTNSANQACTRYEDSCGRDPLTGQIFVPTLEVCHPTSDAVDYWSLFKDTENEIASTSENESWPADERIAQHVDVYQEECPFLKEATSQDNTAQNEIDYENIYTPNDYVADPVALEVDGEAERLAQVAYEMEMEKAYRSLKAWLATVLPQPNEVADNVDVNNEIADNEIVNNEITDESSYFAANETVNEAAAEEVDLSAQLYEDAAATTPAWVDDYFEPETVVSNAIENDYASAENEAARGNENETVNEGISQPAAQEAVEEAVEQDQQVPEYGPYGPALPLSPEPDYVDYDQEYESSYDLKMLDSEENSDWEEEAEETEFEADGSPFQAILRALCAVFSDLQNILPELDDESATLEQLQDASQQVLEQWNEYVAIAQEEAEILASTSEFEDYFAAEDNFESDLAETQDFAGKISVPSNEWLDSVAEGLRATGNLLLNLADELQTTSDGENAVSVRSKGTGSR